MQQVVLGLGGNIGDTKSFLAQAIRFLEQEIGTVKLTSSLYQTKAWGVENQPDFINMVIQLETSLSPDEVLTSCLAIEQKIGRDRSGKKKWAARIVDIDVLFYEDKIINTPQLTLPHSYLHKRNFVLYPLEEMLPDLVHPILLKTVRELKEITKDEQAVLLLKDKI